MNSKFIARIVPHSKHFGFQLTIYMALFFGDLILVHNFFKTPIVGDVTVNLGSIKQTKFLGSWPESVIKSWDLRGLGNKNLMFALDRFVSIIKPDTIVARETILKSIYFILILAIAVGIVLVLQRVLANKMDLIMILLIFFLAIFSASNSFVAMQADLSAAIVATLILALATRQEAIYLIVAGALAPLLFGFKGITILVGISAILAGLAASPKKRKYRMKIMSISWIGSSILSLTFLLVFVKSELVDLANAATLQSNFSYSFLGRMKIALGSLFFQWPHVPIILLGVVVFVSISLKSISRYSLTHDFSSFSTSLFFSLSFLVGFLQIIIQSRGFGYHLACLIPFSFGTVLYLLISKKGLPAVNNSRFVFLSIFVVCLMLSPTTTTVWNHFEEKYAYQIFTDNTSFKVAEGLRLQALERVGEVVKNNCRGKILYLDGGTNYVSPNESWLRYVSPMPLQRDSALLIGNKLRTDSLVKAVQFKGDCITINPLRMNIEKQPWLSELYGKINTEYHVLYNAEYFTYGERNTILILQRS